MSPARARTLLVVFPEMFDQWGGYRLQKLFEPLEKLGWRVVALGAPASSYRLPHELRPWTGVEMHTAFDANPYVLGSLLKRPRNTRSATAEEPSSRIELGPEPPARNARLDVARRLGIGTLNRLWPDYYAGWVPFAVARGLRLVREERPDAMLSSFPPGSAHVAALALRRATGLPWLADFRDPWANASAFGYPAHDGRASAFMEKLVVSRADAVTTVSEDLTDYVTGRYGRAVHTLPQGFKPRPRPPADPSDELRLVYTGTLSRWAADVRPLLAALRRARERGRRISLTLVGVNYDRNADLELAEADGIVKTYPAMTREDALDVVARSDVSLLLLTVSGKIWVTTKIWDYLAAQRPILAIVDPASQAARIVRETRAGQVVPIGSEDLLDAALDDLVERHLDGSLHWEPDGGALARYEVDQVAERLSGLLDELVSRTGRPSRPASSRGRTG